MTLRRRCSSAFAAFIVFGIPANSMAACKLTRLIELPVTMVDSKPIVAAKINGVDAAFVADSGAFYSMLSAANAAALKLKTYATPPGLRVMGIGGETSVSLAKVKVFTLAGIAIPNVEFLVGGGEVGGGVGVLGQNVFRVGDVEYDLAHGVIRVMREEDCGKANLAYWARGTGDTVSLMDIQPTTPLSANTVGSAVINGVKIRVIFDTGASTSYLSLHAAKRAGISVDSPGVKYAGESRGVGRSLIQTWIAPVASFRIGDEEIRNTHLRISEALIESADMLVGADFFLSHRIYVSTKHNQLFFTYNGGPVFSLAVAPAPAADSADVPPAGAGVPTPKADPAATAGSEDTQNAAEFSRRGAALAARRNFAAAFAAFNRACELAPQEPDYFYERGTAYAEDHQRAAALADLDHAIQLRPGHVPALLRRAEIRFGGGGSPQAIDDLDAADRFAEKEADARLRIAEVYAAADRLSAAKTQLDLWIAAHGTDARLGIALSERCRARTLLETELPQALDDCNAAFKHSDKKAVSSASLFSARGLVRLRLGDYPRSIADYDAALKLRPHDAWALFGRGVDEVRSGQPVQGKADMAAAEALWPAVTSEFVKHGIHP